MQRIQCRSEASKGVYCLQYDDQKIVSGLRDNTIKVRLWLLLYGIVSSLVSAKLYVLIKNVSRLLIIR